MFVNIERLKQKMDENGLDGLVATTLGNVYYLTGVYSDGLKLYPYEHQSYAVITRDRPTEPFFIASAGLINQAWMGYKTIRDVVTYGQFYRFGPIDDVELTSDELWLKKVAQEYHPEKTPLDGLIFALKKMGLTDKKIGIDEFNIHCQYLDNLKQRIPSANFVSASKLFREIRKVKTPIEIEHLCRVTKVAENAVLASLSIAGVGVTEYEMAREFDRSVVSQGGKPQFTLIRFGRNGVAGEVDPGRTPLKPEDTIWFDVGLVLEGFWADIARTATLCEPSSRVRKIYQALLAGEQAAIDHTRAGMTGEEVFNLTMDATKNAGLPYYERHHVGHGIGLEVYEDVMIAPGVSDVIEEGTVVNIETPYYEFGLGAIHVEDPFLVSSNGNVLLSTLSRDLMILNR
ncbi:MAG: Xaa-Pro peptidase family protein [Anaerolineaceae bacterium]|nr:Xaa-Pro peptidase family protein [Anaerolineaceae bacterium]